MFVYVIAAFLIAAMEPELTKIDQVSGNRELKLSDFAAFIMLCIAGAFVLFQIQSLAQGIVGAFATAIGHESRRRAYQGVYWSREAVGRSARQTQAAGSSRPGTAETAAAIRCRHRHAAHDHREWNAEIGREGRTHERDINPIAK